ncbi:MAG: DUF6884 domain-containing protein [Phycisphaeraceae bacterium]
MANPDIVLITCVKTKRRKPCAARDLYISPLFIKQRAYAEKSGVPWFILSAEHGVVLPDEWVSPYERYLPDTPAIFRSAWGIWVAARLELLAGPLRGRVCEAHAGSAYLQAIRPHLEAHGATLLDPLHGLSMGARLAWYGSEVGSAEPNDECDDSNILARLLRESDAISPDEFLVAGSQVANRPGLYSWWVDEIGAADLSSGLDLPIEPGLVYGGLAGATRWPSGRRSRNTLWLRIATMHLAGNHEFSTFRRTLGAILAAQTGATDVDERLLSEWMRVHLRVVTVSFEDRDELGRLEKRVLTSLDPPLNLLGMDTTPVRRRLRELRRGLTS